MADIPNQQDIGQKKVYNYNYTSESLISDKVSVDEMVQNYLFGIDLSDQDGNEFPEYLLNHHLNAAIAYAERVLGVQISEEEYVEYHDYHQTDYLTWGYIQLHHYPVKEVTHMALTYGNQEGFVVPTDWIQLSSLTGQVQMFPSHGSASGMIINSQGAIVGLHSAWNYAPRMWKLTYKAGMDVLPPDLYELIYKKAVIGVLQVWGDLILGAGIASQSVSIDGLSQSIGTTQSAMFGGASARCEEYRKDIDRIIPPLKQKYTGVRMVVI